MAEIVRLDRPHSRYSDLAVHFGIARAVDDGNPAEWLHKMRLLHIRQDWHPGRQPAEVRVPRAFYDRLYEFADPLLTHLGGELSFRGVPIVPVED